MSLNLLEDASGDVKLEPSFATRRQDVRKAPMQGLEQLLSKERQHNRRIEPDLSAREHLHDDALNIWRLAKEGKQRVTLRKRAKV